MADGLSRGREADAFRDLRAFPELLPQIRETCAKKPAAAKRTPSGIFARFPELLPQIRETCEKIQRAGGGFVRSSD